LLKKKKKKVRGALAVGPKLWTCSDDLTLRVWDIRDATCDAVLDHHRSTVAAATTTAAAAAAVATTTAAAATTTTAAATTAAATASAQDASVAPAVAAVAVVAPPVASASTALGNRDAASGAALCLATDGQVPLEMGRFAPLQHSYASTGFPHTHPSSARFRVL
jgi:WD40 repeat protein